MPVWVEPIDKRVRAYVGDTVVVDSRAPLLFYEDVFRYRGTRSPRRTCVRTCCVPTGKRRWLGTSSSS